MTGLAFLPDGTTYHCQVDIDDRHFHSLCAEVGRDAFVNTLHGDYEWKRGSIDSARESDAFMDVEGLHVVRSLPAAPQQPGLFEDAPFMLSKDIPKCLRSKEQIIHRVCKDPLAIAFVEWLFGPLNMEEQAFVEHVGLPPSQRSVKRT